MRNLNKSLLSGSILLTAMMAAPFVGAALAQGEEATEEVEEVEAEAVEADEADALAESVECEDGAECEPVEVEASPEVEPETQAADSPPEATEGVVLAAPGSTDESNPGGTTRPGTTPDD